MYAQGFSYMIRDVTRELKRIADALERAYPPVPAGTHQAPRIPRVDDVKKPGN